MGYTNWDNHFAAVQGSPGVTSSHPVATIAALIGLNHLAHRWWRNRNQAKQAQRTGIAEHLRSNMHGSDPRASATVEQLILAHDTIHRQQRCNHQHGGFSQ